jgi:hypothetical protein
MGSSFGFSTEKRPSRRLSSVAPTSWGHDRKADSVGLILSCRRDSFRLPYKDITIPFSEFNRLGTNVSKGMGRVSQAFKETRGWGRVLVGSCKLC